MASLAADTRPLQRSLAQALNGATIMTTLAAEGGRDLRASLSVPGGRVPHLRQHLTELSAELAAQLEHHGWTLTSLAVVAADPASEPPTAPPKKADFVAAIAEAIADQVKSYDVADFCDRLGMPAHPDPDADPHRSKRVYVSSRVQRAEVDDVIAIAHRLLDDYDDPPLSTLLDRYRPGGHSGMVKNLIFGSTRKPDLIVTDALSNDLALVNPEEALLYDGGIPEKGLSWKSLVTYVLPGDAENDLVAAARKLYARLTPIVHLAP